MSECEKDAITLPMPSSTSSSLWPALTLLAIGVLILVCPSIIFAWAFVNLSSRQVIIAALIFTPIALVGLLIGLAISNLGFSFVYSRYKDLQSSDGAAASYQGSLYGQSARLPSPAVFIRHTLWSNIQKRRRQEQAAKYRVPIADSMPQLSEAIDIVIELILRDYVTSWVRAITPEIVLQQRIEELIRILLIRLKNRTFDLDLTQLLVTRLVPKITAHVNDFRRAEMALRGNSLERSLTESDELDIMVAKMFRNGKLHSALTLSTSTTATEEAYLRGVVHAILPTLLPMNEVQSGILNHLLRELLVGAILLPVMKLLSDPDFWNQNVDLYIGKAIREQNMVKKLREALKKHTDNMGTDPRALDSPSSAYDGETDLYSFEDFLKMIKRCDSLLDVKRIRNTIMTQMKKKKALIANRDKEDIVNGHKVEDISIYINRLDIARRRAEKRIEALGGPAYPKRRVREYASESKTSPSTIKLDTILANPSGLSYFMEFLDRRDSMNELQFWLLIDTLDIKSDLNITQEIEPEDQIPESPESAPLSFKSSKKGRKGSVSSTLSSSTSRSKHGSQATTAVDIANTLRDDVRMIYDIYFADSASRPVTIEHSLVYDFRRFALIDHNNTGEDSVKGEKTKGVNNLGVVYIRQRLLEAQQQVFEQMQLKVYPEFIKSNLYFKFLTSYQNSTPEPTNEEGFFGKSRQDPERTQQQSSPILSGFGFSSTKKTSAQDNPKRSSTGSFLEIFGLGREKDKDARERGQNRSFIPGSSSNDSRISSNSWLRPSTPLIPGDRNSTGGLLSSASTMEQSTFAPVQLSRSRSLSSIPHPPESGPTYWKEGLEEGHDGVTSKIEEASAMGGFRSKSAQQVDSHELDQENYGDEEGIFDKEKGGLEKIPGLGERSRQNTAVIDAVEAVGAALSTIMENHANPGESTPSLTRQSNSSFGALENQEDPHLDAKNPHNNPSEKGTAVDTDVTREKGFSENTAKGTAPASSGDTEKLAAESKLRDGGNDRGASFRFGQYSDSEEDTLSSEATQGSAFPAQEDVHLAAPGDLLLARRIEKLAQYILSVKKQEAIVEELIKKAERQGRQNELRILKKSKSTLRREILSLEYQKTQYEVQEEENMIMPGRSTINITSSTVGHDGNKEFALYVIEVHQLASDGNYASGWIIARRYSEFFALHQQLKEKFSVVKNYELPAKRGFLKLQRTFVEGRRIGLERYLQQLLRHEDICQSQELRAFLSQENVALPQFSSSPNQTSILPYITTEGRNSMSREDEGKGAGFGSSTSDQSFFGNFFQPASSPSISPQNTKDGSNSMAQPYSGMDKEFATNVGDESLAPGDEEGFMKHIYQTVSEGLDDMFSGGPPNVLGNITKQLGNQMMQFSVVEEETDSDKPQQEGAAILEGKELLGASRRDTIQAPSNGQEYQRGSAPVPRTFTRKLSSPHRPTTLDTPPGRIRRLSSPYPSSLSASAQSQEARTTIFQNSAVGQVHSDNDQFGQHQGQPVTSILEQPEGVTVLTAPVCDLFIELFELKEKNNWLRRQAMLIILQQVFGGAIERKLRDTIKLYTEESMLVFYVTKLRDTLWAPTEASNGTGREEKATMASGSTSPSLQGSDSAQMRLHVDDQKTRSSGAAQGTTSGQTQKSARTPEQKAQTKDQANRKLSAFLPELLGSMVGHQNARRGARRAFAAFQNQRLNQQLVYTILDEVVSAVWPELKLSEASTLAS